MEAIDLICLANSFKHRGRCIAGLRLDGKGWVRPVAATPHGELYPTHYRLVHGSRPQILDVVRINSQAHRPLPHQPENWLITDAPWKLVGRPGAEELADVLRSNLTRGPDLFGDREHRIAMQQIESQPRIASLALVEPEGLQWFIEHKPHIGKRPRAHFALGNAFYDLPVTDPAWVDAFRQLDCGLYPLSACGLPADRKLLLTISLGDEFENDSYCYKLVAGLVPVAKTFRRYNETDDKANRRSHFACSHYS